MPYDAIVAPAKRKRTHYEIDLDRFVAEWTRASSAEEVCRTMSLPRHIVYATSRRLRDSGVQLKEFRRARINKNHLNEIIRKVEEGES